MEYIDESKREGVGAHERKNGQKEEMENEEKRKSRTTKGTRNGIGRG